VTTTETNTQPPPEAAIPDIPSEIDNAVITAITNHLARALTGMHRVGSNFVRIDGTADHNDVTLELTRRRFDGDDCAVRVVLTITSSEVIPPAELPQDISAHTQALLDVWAHDDPGPGDAA
jgi:hypothetical protein